MIKNFFKAIGFFMKEFAIIIWKLYVMVGIISTVVQVVLSCFIQNIKLEQADLGLLHMGCFAINFMLYMFISNCIEAARYAKDHDVDIRTALIVTSYCDDEER